MKLSFKIGARKCGKITKTKPHVIAEVNDWRRFQLYAFYQLRHTDSMHPTAMTEKLVSLPRGWSRATLNELISYDGIFSDGDWVESKDQNPDGEVRLIQLADIGDGYFKDKSDRFLSLSKSIELNCTYLEKGDLLIARLPDPLGRSCLFPLTGKEQFVTVVDICIVRTKTNEISNKYLLHLINSPSVRLQIDKYKTGSTRKRISRKNLTKVNLSIAPVAEQHRIVDRIEELFSELDDGIASLKTAQQKLKIYRQAAGPFQSPERKSEPQISL